VTELDFETGRNPATDSSWRGRVAIHALGCKANQEEIECLVSRLSENGFAVVPFGQPADWTIVNTCTVTQAADSDSRQWIRRAVRAKGEGKLVVTGCMVQRDPLGVSKIEGVDWVVGNAEKANLAGWILDESALPADSIFEGADSCTRLLVGADPTLGGFAEYGSSTDGRRTRATLKVQDGCDEHCTFCVIPQVRGRSRSRPLALCLAEAEKLTASGYREIALTGINTALWGRDLEPVANLSELLSALLWVDGLARIRLNSLEPQYVTLDWLDLLASDSRFCRHFHFPLQSGSDRILRRMNRRYDLKRYREVIEATFERMPDAAIGCDVMVGFPGEDDDDFEDALEFLSSLPLAYLHVFSYSPRPGTASPKLGEPVFVPERKERSARMRRLSTELREAHERRQIGSMQTVIPEAPSGDGWWQGLTGNYVRVRFPWKNESPPGSEARAIRIERVRDGRVEGRLGVSPSNTAVTAPVKVTAAVGPGKMKEESV